MDANIVRVAGRILKSELRYTNATQTAVCNFTIETVRQRIIKGETRFHRVTVPFVAWDTHARVIHQRFPVGAYIEVEGRLDESQSIAQSRAPRRRLQIVVEKFRVANAA
jgi:single-stranded DNA-binding protein